MKLFPLIFSFYLLLLPFLPCEDATECETGTISLSQTTGHSDHEEPEACTPFCYCACCSVNTISSPVLFAQDLPVASYANYFSTDFELPAKVLYSIWQPPKVS